MDDEIYRCQSNYPAICFAAPPKQSGRERAVAVSPPSLGSSTGARSPRLASPPPSPHLEVNSADNASKEGREGEGGPPIIKAGGSWRESRRTAVRGRGRDGIALGPLSFDSFSQMKGRLRICRHAGRAFKLRPPATDFFPSETKHGSKIEMWGTAQSTATGCAEGRGSHYKDSRTR